MSEVTDWKTPGTCANADRDGKPPWVEVVRALTSNDEWASCDVGKGDYNDWLRVTNFGFSTGDIPSGATIDGIEVKIERRQQTGCAYINDSALYLRKSTGQVGDNKASATKWPEPNDAEATYGASDDDWNSSLADSDIRDSGFGVDLSAYNSYATSAIRAYVDCISIRVHYTPPPYSPATRSANMAAKMIAGKLI